MNRKAKGITNEHPTPNPVNPGRHAAESKPLGKQCNGLTKRGTPCTALAMEGGLCYFHANPDKAAELGRIGGRRKKRVIDSDTDDQPIEIPQSARDVKNVLADVMARTRKGLMDPKTATALGYLGASLLRAIEVAELEQQLERLERTHGIENQSQTTKPNGELTVGKLRTDPQGG